jgi:hypothetical protein
MQNKADLYQPVVAVHVGKPPLTIRAVVTDNNSSMVGGVPQSTTRGEVYVLLSALPKELQERVKTSVQAIIAGM